MTITLVVDNGGGGPTIVNTCCPLCGEELDAINPEGTTDLKFALDLLLAKVMQHSCTTVLKANLMAQNAAAIALRHQRQQ